MAAYITRQVFRTKVEFLTPQDLDLFESMYPGVIDDTIGDVSDEIDSRLCKRYGVPFNPVPRIIQRWTAIITTERILNRRGYNPSDPQMARMLERVTLADDQIKEAANSQEALFGLPSGGGTQGDGAVVRGGPLWYSESSPYVGADQLEEHGVLEDAFRRGTFGGK